MRPTRIQRRRLRRFIGPKRSIAAASLLAVAAVVASLSSARPGAQSVVQTIDCGSGFGAVADVAAVFTPLTSLRGVPNPVFPPIDPVTQTFNDLGVPQDLTKPGQLRVTDTLTPYIRNVEAAIQLGKALFWDMQAGSDNQTACATCHFQAGADGRSRNQLSAGFNGSFDAFAVNHQLAGADFPFKHTATGNMRTDNVVGSQGVRKMQYDGLGSNGSEITTALPDPVFNVGGDNVRQVGGLQAPPVLNAVFNHRNFWDGRAQPEFNGVNNWGSRDGAARVWTLDLRGNPVTIDIRIPDASLASQAVGPPLNPLEMTAAGRTFPELGKKMLARKPLGLQRVDPTDSVLGGLAEPTQGLKTTYTALIEAAFYPQWWNSRKTVSIGGKSYSMTQANFSLFWGLSIMLYEATLVSDDTPMDRYLASRVFNLATGQLDSHDPTLLQPLVTGLQDEFPGLTVDDVIAGLALFELPLSPETAKGNGIPAGFGAGCTGCHVGAELTSASIRNLTDHPVEPGDLALRNAGFDLRMERMFMQIPPVPEGSTQITYDPTVYDVKVTRVNGETVTPSVPAPAAVYDTGWYNVGVRRTLEIIGLGGKDPWGKFLSWTQSLQASANPSNYGIPGGGLGCAQSPPAAPSTSVFAGEVLNPLTGLPLLAGPLRATERVAIDGSVKTPSLRNVELTGPYFHNGGKATLMQVLDFYDAGGDFSNPTRAPLIMPLVFEESQERDLLAFLVALTDDRVRYQRAPFDHPELVLPNGVHENGADVLETLAPVGRAGTLNPIGRFLGLSLTDEGTEPPPVEPVPLPVAKGDTYTMDEDTVRTFDVLANDAMDNGTPIPSEATLQLVVLPSHGSAVVNPDRTIRYTPAANYFGPDSLQYRVTVGGEPSTATVSITVLDVAEPPPPTASITISQASYQVKRDRWIVSGSTTGVSAGTSLEIRYLAPGASDGPVFARATVSSTGTWLLDSRGSGVKAASGSKVKVVSPSGASQVANVTIN